MMKILALSLVCIVWLSSFSAHKWSGQTSGDIHVDEKEPLTDSNFSDSDFKVNRLKTATLQERCRDPRFKTELPSVLYRVITAFRGMYVFWMFHFFCSWYLKTGQPLDTDSGPTTDDSDDYGSETSRSSADEDSFVAVDTSTVLDDVPETVEEVVAVMVDVIVTAETLVTDVTNSVDAVKVEPVVDEEILSGFSNFSEDSYSEEGSMDSPEMELLASVPDASESSSMDTNEGEILAPLDIAVPGTSGGVQTVQDEEPVPLEKAKKPNFFRRAKKALKKWKGSKKKNPGKEPVCDVPPPPEPKTLEEINRMWMEEKTPYLRRIPKVHFRQGVEVKTFLVNRPMARYEEKRGAGPSEVTQVEPLKKEGDFKEVGVFNTKKSLKHRFLRALRRD